MAKISRRRFTTIPDDILVQILARIPMKSLYRFKTVSKSWRNLISSDPWLKQLKVHYSFQFPRLISFETKGSGENQEVTLITTDFGFGTALDEFPVRVASKMENPFVQVTSCRDLICIFSDIEIVVCNPSNRGLIKFENSSQNSPNCVGIGYAASSDTYKVAKLFDHRHRIGCNILTIKENSDVVDGVFSCVFNEFSFGPLRYSPSDDCLPICVKGIMYWMLKNPPDWRILAYFLDLENRQFGTIPCPRFEIADKLSVNCDNDLKLVELHGWLCVESFRAILSTIAFYALKDVGLGTWEMFYKISIRPVDVYRPGFAHVLGVAPRASGDGEIVISRVKGDGLETVYRYSRNEGMKKVEFSCQPKGRFKFLCFESMFTLRSNIYS